VAPQPEDGDERQYEVDYIVRDTTLVWARSRGDATGRALAMGYAEISAVREVPDEPQ
jgi:hypothetical protein